MNRTILEVIGPGCLNQVPTLHRFERLSQLWVTLGSPCTFGQLLALLQRHCVGLKQLRRHNMLVQRNTSRMLSLTFLAFTTGSNLNHKVN